MAKLLEMDTPIDALVVADELQVCSGYPKRGVPAGAGPHAFISPEWYPGAPGWAERPCYPAIPEGAEFAVVAVDAAIEGFANQDPKMHKRIKDALAIAVHGGPPVPVAAHVVVLEQDVVTHKGEPVLVGT